jgi:hypothetical protein
MLKSPKLELFFVVANNRAIVLQQWNVTFVSAEAYTVRALTHLYGMN